jgi:hypothetical protein
MQYLINEIEVLHTFNLVDFRFIAVRRDYAVNVPTAYSDHPFGMPTMEYASYH